MAANSKIEWCDHTFNPWIGCSKVSPACDHCYAEALNKRMGWVLSSGRGAPSDPVEPEPMWGGSRRKRTSEANWKQPLRWNRKAEIAFSTWRKFKATQPGLTDEQLEAQGFVKPRRPRVFCASLADVFDNAVPPTWRIELFALIAETPHLDWLLLTKRIGNAAKMIETTIEWERHKVGTIAGKWPWPNVWIGATVCNQAEADRDIPKLLAVPAAKRFLSIEPMLGPIDISFALPWRVNGPLLNKTINWVICGGESGPHARPMHPDWVRSLRDQCVAAGVPFFMKQMGGVRNKRSALEDLPEDLRIREIPHE